MLEGEIEIRTPPHLMGEGWGGVVVDKRLLSNAKNMRKNPTDAERVLWNHLRAKQLEGIKFRRQDPVGSYIADFVCHDRKVVVEVDGGQHADDHDDKERDDWFETQGYRVLRFWNNEVLNNIEGVLEKVREVLTPSP